MPEELEEEREVQAVQGQRPKCAKLMAEESLKRLEEFPQRKEQIIAASRKSKGQDLPF